MTLILYISHTILMPNDPATRDAFVQRVHEANGNVSYDQHGNILQVALARSPLLSSATVDDAWFKDFCPGEMIDFLNLTNSNIGDRCLEYIRDIAVRRLSLHSTRVTDAGVRYCRDLVGLEELSLTDTVVGDSGMEQLAPMHQLRILSLAGTAVTDRGVPNIARNNGLQDLSLAKTAVTDVGVVELHKLTQLEVLVLSDTAITDVGANYIRDLPILRNVSFDRTMVTDHSLAYFVDRPLLRVLHVVGARTTVAGRQQFASLRPDVRLRYR